MPKLLTHPSRSVRICGTFVLVLSCYWVYAIAAVPFIEPETEITTVNGQRPKDQGQRSQRKQNDIDVLFGPDDWERRDPVILENQRGKLLIGEYKNNSDGSVAISPCTIIMLPDGEFPSEEERIRQSIVLQALDKAVLRFDEPFDIRKGSIGKLVAGNLHGPILIRSDQKQPGPQDDLVIETRDVALSEDVVTTDHPVKFRWGTNHGSGRQMRIDLMKAAPKAKTRGPQVDGIKALTLLHDVRLHLVPDEKQLQATLKRDAVVENRPGRWQPLPVEVTCQGPFRFDLEERVATFQDRVDVLQVQPNGPSDQISGEVLKIHFAPKDSAAENAADKAKPGKERLQPQRLEMQGNPVIVRSPINAVLARGQRLEYDMPTRRLGLSGEGEVVVTRGGDEIRARELIYQPGDAGRLGKFLAVGPGWLRGTMPEQAQKIEAHWGKQLWFRPDADNPQLDIVSLEGAADARVPGMGGLQAEEIFCWLSQQPAQPRPAPSRPPNVTIAPNETKTELTPDRLLARGQVQIDSPQLTGATEQLETWFEQRSPPAAAGGPAATASRNGPGAAANPQGPPPPGTQNSLASLAQPRGPADQRFNVTGKLIRVKLAMNGRQADLSQLVIDGQARFAEIPNAERQSSQPPMLVEGDLLHVVQTDPQQATVVVTGKPAHVEAGGMGLRGAEINLNRATNQLWIEGAGLMTMQVDRDMQGRPLEKPQPLEVNWDGGMVFNGLTARFEQKVVARTQQQLLRTEMLEIALSRKIDFSQSKQGDRPDVAEVICRGGVVLDSKTFDEQGLASIEHIETADLSINRLTGAVHANAFTDPKRRAVIVQVRRGDNSAGLAVPGVAKQPAVDDQKGKGLSYIHVQFRRAADGDLNLRQMAFGNEVRSIYGPVTDWNGVLTEENLGERGILLTCDKMLVREMPGAKPDEHSTELEAVGNASVEGAEDTFRATAVTIRYSSEKGRLVLEGDGRRDVKFIQRPMGGAEREISAGKVEYTPATRHLKLDRVTSGSAIEPGK